MTVKNKTNKNYKRSQRGRSMVEMLGVLAIVGTLSVGGVYGYGVAMKKHKANELLHQASILATTVSAQAMTNDGKLPETTTSFANSSYGTFDQSVTEALDGKGFAITIKEVDSAVCGQLEKMAGGMVREATCDGTTATITYYKNLATNDEDGKNSPTGTTTEPVDPACADVTCEEGLTCFNGQCKCPSGLFMCGEQCCAEGTYCTMGTNSSIYECAGTGGYCSKNSDCEEGEYCYVTESVGFFGDCGIRDEIISITLELSSGDLTLYTVPQPKYGYSTPNWWSAVNLCNSLDKEMLTIHDLGITFPNNQKSYCFYDYAMADSVGETDSKCICLGDEGCIQTKSELAKLQQFSWLADIKSPKYRYGIIKSYGLIDLLYVSRLWGETEDGSFIYPLCR